MFAKNAEVGRINQSSLDRELEDWKESDKLVVTGHPRENEYKEISKAAVRTLSQMSLALMMPSGYEKLQQGATHLQQLTERALALRKEMGSDSLATSFGVKPGVGIQGTLESRVEQVMTPLGMMGAALLPDFKQVISTIAMDPYANPQAVLNATSKSRKFLQKVMQTQGITPELKQLATELGQGLDKMTAINPFVAHATAHKNWYNETFAGKRLNTKPMRILGAMFGSVVATVGIIQTAMDKDHKLSPATVFWAGTTGLLAFPSLIAGNGMRMLDSYAALGNPHIHDLVASAFKGTLGRQALNELQKIGKDKRVDLKALIASKEPPNPAQIGYLTGNNSSSPLLKVLQKLPQEKWGKALQTFGKAMNDGTRELLGEMLEARV